MKSAGILLAIFLATGCATAPRPQPGPEREMASHQLDGRHFYVHVPANPPAGTRPLVVMIHGCMQTAKAFARASNMNQLADEQKFFVAYPEQIKQKNPYQCWNWFLPANQERGSGDPALVVKMIEDMQKRYPIDPARIYLAGISSGSGLAHTLATCYPDVFAAAALHSGPGSVGMPSLPPDFSREKGRSTGEPVFHEPNSLEERPQWLGGRCWCPLPVARPSKSCDHPPRRSSLLVSRRADRRVYRGP